MNSLQASVVDNVLLTALQGLAIVGILGFSLSGVHLLVRALRAEHGRLRNREAWFVLVAAGVLFVTGFARLVVADGVPSGSLAFVALGFIPVAYLLYLAQLALFEPSAQDKTTGEADAELGH